MIPVQLTLQADAQLGLLLRRYPEQKQCMKRIYFEAIADLRTDARWLYQVPSDLVAGASALYHPPLCFHFRRLIHAHKTVVVYIHLIEREIVNGGNQRQAAPRASAH